jgi:hypothetical protein
MNGSDIFTMRSDIPLRTTTITEKEWTAALKLSTMWDFFEVRKLAIEELPTVVVNPVTKILLARQYSLPKLLFTGYKELVQRTEPIKIGEAEQLGWDTAILIFQIREESLAKFQASRIEATINTIRAQNYDSERGSETGGMESEYNIQDIFDRKHCDGAEGIRKAFAKELEDANKNEVVAILD